MIVDEAVCGAMASADALGLSLSAFCVQSAPNALGSCTTTSFAEAVRKAAKGSLLTRLEPLLKTLDVIEPQLSAVEEELGKLCGKEPVVAHLCTAPGVGAIVAASFWCPKLQFVCPWCSA